MLRRSLLLLLLVTLIGLNVSACGPTPTRSGALTPIASDASSTPPAAVSPTGSLTPNLTSTPLQLTGVSISMNPSNFGTIACGTSLNIVFSAQITAASGGNGAVAYTWNIDNTSIPGNVTFSTGQTVQTVTYTLNNVAMQLTSTSTVSASINAGSTGSASVSANVVPTGVCRLPGPFQVVSINMSVNPSTVDAVACGAFVNITYSATVIIAPDSNAGTVSLVWSTNPGHASVSIVFAPLQTVGTVTVTLDEVSSHHTSFPRPVSISSTSPNVVNGGPVRPAGQCH
ncbi:MAG: hypothetical protein ACRDIV_09045 [Ktedonobacteraceae bacterium]